MTYLLFINQEAYDRVDSNILLEKLQQLYLPEHFLTLFQSY